MRRPGTADADGRPLKRTPFGSLVRSFGDAGVPATAEYDHQPDRHRAVCHPAAPLPVTERLTRESLILPLHHLLTEADQDRPDCKEGGCHPINATAVGQPVWR